MGSSQLREEHFRRCFSGKVFGARHLWEACGCALRPTDFFCLASSVVSLLGAPGQGAYGAANAVLDRLAEATEA
ncbi:unnamed protein product [Effrenium voratum]|uniref:Ketoreductase (KR) domain-containing protein n=1 Tax=Effrenium voratum TaxID=2562239 RepID=A0AA36JLB5_9DINO|nr:unnamed protein product [Effrenium voratum]